MDPSVSSCDEAGASLPYNLHICVDRQTMFIFDSERKQM